MEENFISIKLKIEQQLPSFTGRIIIDMLQGEVGAIEQTVKKRYALKKKQSHNLVDQH